MRRIINKIPGIRFLLSVVKAQRESRRLLRDRKTLQESGPDLLRLVHSRLHGKIPYFLDYGSLLGLVRENAFLKHDDDVDFGVMPGVRAADLIRALDDSELQYLGSYVYDGMVTEVGYTFRKMRVDFFLNSVDGEDFHADVYYDAPGVKYSRHETGCHRFTRPAVKGLKTVEFVGAHVDIPTNPEDLLAAHYGPNWRHPDPTWTQRDADGHYGCVLLPGVGRYLVPREEVISLN